MESFLPKKAIEEFQAIYKKEFGIDLSDQEASEQAVRLLRLFKIIYKPIERKELNNGKV